MPLPNSSEESKRDFTETPLVVFGEVLYDCFSSGERVLGGAPFNVAWALKGLGQEPILLSSVGKDAAGEEVVQNMRKWGLSIRGLQISERHATGEVRVSFDEGEPNYRISHPRAWDFIYDVGWQASELIYHGSLALRDDLNRASLEAILSRSKAKRFFDVNLRAPYDDLERVRSWLCNADWVKLNLEELRSIQGDTHISLADAPMVIGELQKQYRIENVLLTAGSEGAMLFLGGGQRIDQTASVIESYVDSVGAGDAFTSRCIHGILSNESYHDMMQAAADLAAEVCGLQGATTKAKSFYK